MSSEDLQIISRLFPGFLRTIVESKRLHCLTRCLAALLVACQVVFLGGARLRALRLVQLVRKRADRKRTCPGRRGEDCPALGFTAKLLMSVSLLILWARTRTSIPFGKWCKTLFDGGGCQSGGTQELGSIQVGVLILGEGFGSRFQIFQGRALIKKILILVNICATRDRLQRTTADPCLL